jgi:PAS domain S-box-containing protein
VPLKVQENSRKAVYIAAAALAALVAAATVWTLLHDAASGSRDAFGAGALAGALAVAVLAGVSTVLLAPQFRRSGSWTRAIAENELRLNSIIGSAMDAMITLDEQQRIVLFNAAAEKIFLCEAADAIGSPIERFIPERYRSGHAAHVKRFGEAGITMRRMGGAVVLAGLRTDGDEFPIDASISHVNVGGRKFYTVILRDVTERQRAADALTRSHEELHELYEAMHQVREAERTRIARELHDELAQWLTALKMDVSWIRARLPQDGTLLTGKADRRKTVIDNTIAAMRRIAADLRPLMLDDLGLVPAIENLLHELADRTGIAVELTGSDALEALREPLVTAVYRMVQEALTNVARHAHASRVEVSLEMTEDRLSVSITDDGVGLRPDPGGKSFGLAGIRERARTLGGEARIYSPQEGGTIVAITVPLQRQLEESRT